MGTDENGQLLYFDRKIDIIDQEGKKIFASKIERVLQDHEAVSEACVVGTSDSSGKVHQGIVVNSRSIDSKELIRWCSERLESNKVSDFIEFRDFLPKSKYDKLLRRITSEGEERRKS